MPIVEWDLESSLDVWEVQSGTFDILNGAVQSTNCDDDEVDDSVGLNAHKCDHIFSPALVLSSNSTLSISTSIETEECHDGGLVALFYDNEVHVVEPDGGRPYHDKPIWGFGPSCPAFSGNAQAGWAGDLTTFEESTFSADALNLTLPVGETKEVIIGVYHAGDGSVCEVPFKFNNVRVTYATLAPPVRPR